MQIGAILNGYTIFDNCIVAFGGEFNRADYPKLWAYLQANLSLVAPEGSWHAEATVNGGICGYFSDGDGTTTFRVPNLDKAFLRPDSRSVASFQVDEFKEHFHDNRAVGSAANTIQAAPDTGVAYYGTAPFSGLYTSPVGGSETRPKNIAVLPLIVAK